MVILEKSNRIKNIEKKFNTSIKDLLYKMHWSEDMMHKEIGQVINIPRATVTKWFDRLKIPTQSCRRFTDKNLTSWLYKTGQLKKKIRYNGPDRRIQRTKGRIDVDFFKKWSSAMAYVLGYFCADGCMFINSGGSKYISFVSNDRELLAKVRAALKSNHKIVPKKQTRPNCSPTFWFQIGCKDIYDDIVKLGIMQRKESRLKLPRIPRVYFNSFIRGYFDGDGCVTYGYYKRKNRISEVMRMSVKFASASVDFLAQIKNKLSLYVGLRGGFITSGDGCKYLVYSKGDSNKLFDYLYKKISSEIYLKRKYNTFRKIFAN
mgnify:CR=1 FL=1